MTPQQHKQHLLALAERLDKESNGFIGYAQSHHGIGTDLLIAAAGAATELREYAARLTPGDEDKWQPIDSAPKDVEVFLAAYIIPSDAAQANGSRNHWTYGTGRHLWDDQWSGILGSTPSHWKPLEPPK